MPARTEWHSLPLMAASTMCRQRMRPSLSPTEVSATPACHPGRDSESTVGKSQADHNVYVLMAACIEVSGKSVLLSLCHSLVMDVVRPC